MLELGRLIRTLPSTRVEAASVLTRIPPSTRVEAASALTRIPPSTRVEASRRLARVRVDVLQFALVAAALVLAVVVVGPVRAACEGRSSTRVEQKLPRRAPQFMISTPPGPSGP